MGQQTPVGSSAVISAKNPTTYEQQVKLIETKGFKVEDKKSSIEFLNQANYYRVSAYFLPFKKKDGTYFSGVSFCRIQRIYEFDSRIRTLVFQAVEQIELFIRAQFSYHLAHKYGALGYLNDFTYTKRHNSEVFHSKILACIAENRRTPVV